MYWAVGGALFIGIVKTSGTSNKTYALAPHIDVHAHGEEIKKEAERRMREEARAKEEAKYWKEYKERQEKEKKEKEKKE